jgi:hypothetical protein
LILSPSIVSSSWGAPSTMLAGLVDNLIGLETWTQAPNTDSLDCSTTAWVQIDMGQVRSMSSVSFWSYYDGRTYCSISITLSASCLFAGEQITVFSCTTFGTCPTLLASGYTISFGALNARCVRWTSGRSNFNTGIHFMEISVSTGVYTKRGSERHVKTCEEEFEGQELDKLDELLSPPTPPLRLTVWNQIYSNKRKPSMLHAYML